MRQGHHYTSKYVFVREISIFVRVWLRWFLYLIVCKLFLVYVNQLLILHSTVWPRFLVLWKISYMITQISHLLSFNTLRSMTLSGGTVESSHDTKGSFNVFCLLWCKDVLHSSFLKELSLQHNLYLIIFLLRYTEATLRCPSKKVIFFLISQNESMNEKNNTLSWGNSKVPRGVVPESANYLNGMSSLGIPLSSGNWLCSLTSISAVAVK